MSAGAVCVAVVEDDLALGQLIVDVLEGAQLSARWFKRGQDFLQACLGPQAFAAALLDMRLPDMTGLRVLQSMPTESSPPVMMLTGMTEES
ncbi:MAG: response regulator, partial [Burkholderiaceae bacterium]